MPDAYRMQEILNEVNLEYKIALSAVTDDMMKKRYDEPVAVRPLRSETEANEVAAALIVAMSTIDMAMMEIPYRSERLLEGDVASIKVLMANIARTVSSMHVDYVRAKRALDKAA